MTLWGNKKALKKNVRAQSDYKKYCGAGGNRTRVQTRNKYAFYTLSFTLIFVIRTA